MTMWRVPGDPTRAKGLAGAMAVHPSAVAHEVRLARAQDALVEASSRLRAACVAVCVDALLAGPLDIDALDPLILAVQDARSEAEAAFAGWQTGLAGKAEAAVHADRSPGANALPVPWYVPRARG